MADRDRLEEIAQRHGMQLTPAFERELLQLLSRSGPPMLAAELTLADGPNGAGYDTWYAEAPTQPVDPTEPTEATLLLAGRYEGVDLLGAGGMGEVHRAHDRVLNRTVALKLATRVSSPALRSRFYQEAQATAQLDHPGIVPLYDYGELEDGTPYYTMPVVRGRTLSDGITAVHEQSTATRWVDAEDGLSFRRLVVSFLTVCEAMAHAHDRGVIHRDLKPENIMLGPYGQTLVVDWGLAKVLGDTESEQPLPDRVVSTARSSSSDQTSFGTVTGTPHYMAPEQARGEVHSLGPASDVWSLGAILYELLSGRPPFLGASKVEVLAAVIARDPDPVASATRLPLPVELSALAHACLQRNARSRPGHAGELAAEVRAWLDGERRREQAMDLVRRADQLVSAIETHRAEAAQCAHQATTMLAALESHRPVEEKLPGWALLERAEQLQTEADRTEQERLTHLRHAHTLAPDLPEPNNGLADWYRARHREAERAGEARRAAELEALLRTHDTGPHARYLDGQGTVALAVDPPGAWVTVRPWVPHQRRLVPGEPAFVGPAPIAVDLPAGAYLLTLEAPGRATAHYPIRLERGGAWNSSPPGGASAAPVRLPEAGALRASEVYVPAGWFRFGGDPEAHASPAAQELWLDGFAIDRTPVTVTDWLDFLAHLKAADQGELLQLCSPDPAQMALVERGGGLVPGPDREGFEWSGHHAMPFVSYAGALAYAEWRAARDGLGWRLPTEPEWEKAARGTDGRLYPWGNFLDPTWCAIQGSREGDAVPVPVGSHPVDCSPYGVLDCAGGLTEWTADPYRAEGPAVDQGRPIAIDPAPSADGSGRRVGRGASFYYAPMLARVCTRYSLTESRAEIANGLRLVRSLP